MWWTGTHNKRIHNYVKRHPTNHCFSTTLEGLSFRGFKLRAMAGKNARETESGDRALGFADISDGRLGVAAGVRYFWWVPGT